MKPWEAKTETTAEPAEQLPPNIAFQRARPATMGSDVMVPVAQALVTGILVAAVFWITGWSKYWASWGIICTFVVWLVQTVNVNRLLWAAEKRWQIDINKDGHKGRPAPAKYPGIILTKHTKDGGRFKDPRSKVPSVKEQHPFEKFVLACERVGTDMRFWEGQMGLPREVYQDWRDKLMDAGCAMWNSFNSQGDPNNRQGWHLTMPAKEILENCTYE